MLPGVSLGWLGGMYLLPWLLPLPERLESSPESSLRVVDRHGEVLRETLVEEAYRCQPVSYESLPPALISCLLAAEDGRFWDHGGVDFYAMGRVIRDGLRYGKFYSGGSTITQQLVKISSPPRSRNLLTKIREALLSRQLEMRWDKPHILQEYCNRVDFGNHCRGVAAAAESYFQKPLGDLSLAECALLASLPQAPTRLDPLRHLPAAQKRRDWVLGRVVKLGLADAASVARAVQEKLVFRPLPMLLQRAGHAVDLLLRHASLTQIGLVTTTIDLTCQTEVEEIVRQEMSRFTTHPEAAAVVLDNATGEILALVGSTDYALHPFNAALAPRSAGSTLKPFTYLLALEAGRYPGTLLPDVPTTYLGPTGLMEIENYDHRHRGPVSLRQALANSLNIPAVRVLNEIGGPTALRDKLVAAGITTLDENASLYGLGLTIGNAPVSLLELTTAYSALARQGRYRPATLCQRDPLPAARPMTTPEIAWIIGDILSDNAARSASFGAASALRFPWKVAVKTGTSSDFHDNWCVGYTPEITIGVWMGNLDASPMPGLSGVSGAGPIFHRIMMEMAQRRTLTWPDRPPGVMPVILDARIGKLANSETPLESQVMDFCLVGHPPKPCTGNDFSPDGLPLLDDATYAQWFHGQPHGQVQLASAGRAALPPLPPQILSPMPHAIYVLDPELPNGGTKLPLRSTLLQDARWSSETLAINPQQTCATLVPGHHRIQLQNIAAGTRSEVWIEVQGH